MKKYAILFVLALFFFSCKSSKITQGRLANTVWATDVNYSGMVGLSFIPSPRGNCSISFLSFGKGAVHRNCDYIIKDKHVFISGRTVDNKDFQITGALTGKNKIKLTFFQMGQEIYSQELRQIRESTRVENPLLEELLIR